MSSPKKIQDVVQAQLCSGCGACAYLSEGGIKMVDDEDYGRIPLEVKPVENHQQMIQACPGIELAHESPSPEEKYPEARGLWGPIYAIYEGYSSDDEIRFSGSSGGAATALSLYAIETGQSEGIVHIGSNEEKPYQNQTIYSKSKSELIKHTGSRYSPASPCEGLEFAEKASGSSVFIGKPCDVAAVKRIKELKPEMNEKINFTVAIFCAGVPSTKGTLALLDHLGTSADDVSQLRYRGNGWPGRASANSKSGADLKTLSYQESWGGILEKFRPWKCYICADHTGEFADIAVGDPWYRELSDDEPGQSLLIARTPKGKKVIDDAIAKGYLIASEVGLDLLENSQPNIAGTRGKIWGRLLAMQSCFITTPTYVNLPTFKHWLKLSFKEKLQSFYGTYKRILTKKLYKPRVPTHYK